MRTKIHIIKLKSLRYLINEKINIIHLPSRKTLLRYEITVTDRFFYVISYITQYIGLSDLT